MAFTKENAVKYGAKGGKKTLKNKGKKHFQKIAFTRHILNKALSTGVLASK